MDTRLSPSAEAKIDDPRLSHRRDRVLSLVDALPGAEAMRLCEGSYSFELHGRGFGFLLDNHLNDGRMALNCKVTSGPLPKPSGCAADRYHTPKYLPPNGWFGLWLDLGEVDWDDVAVILQRAYHEAAVIENQILPRDRPI